MKRSWIWILLLIATASWAASPAGQDSLPPNPPDRLIELEPGLYRSALPGREGMAWLASQGVRTVISMVTNRKDAREERELAEALGMRAIHVPLQSLVRPRDEDIALILDAMRDRSLRPLVVHCHHGRDRTGLVVGLHRIREQGWAPTDAYREMLDVGYRSRLVGLDCYFRERTGWKKSDLCRLVPTAGRSPVRPQDELEFAAAR